MQHRQTVLENTQVREILMLAQFFKRTGQCVLALIVATAALAQNDRGVITGTVTDQAHAVVANASVSAKNVDTGAVFDTKTTGAGDYTLVQLVPGTYIMTVEATGFQKFVGTGTQVAVGNTLRIDVTLTVGAVTESITVEATAPLLKSESPEQSQVVDEQEIKQLPLQGTGGSRNPRALVILVPGVSGSGTGTGGRINGQTANTQHIYIDGQDIYSANGNGTNTGPPPQEMIEAYELQTTQYSAEYSTPQGGVYVFATKAAPTSCTEASSSTGRITCSTPTSPTSTPILTTARTISASASADPWYSRSFTTAGTRPSSTWFPRPPRTFSPLRVPPPPCRRSHIAPAISAARTPDAS
jgi:hypothetical protein